MKNLIVKLSSNLYRKEIIRRVFKDSKYASIVPKVYYNFFLRKRQFPPYINIEITNVCNLECPMCPNPKIPEGKKGYMALELFRKIIEEIDRFGTSNLMFVKQGEPLLHPQVHEFFSVLRSAKNRQNVLWVSNGTTLTQTHIDALIEYEIDELNLSIDSLQPEIYFQIKGFGLDKVLRGIERLQESKKRNKSELPRLSVNMVVRKDNVHELKFAREFFKKQGIQHTVQKYNKTFTGIDVGTTQWTLKEETMPSRYPCAHVFTNFVINYDGSVSLCCADWKSDFLMGDLNQKSIYDIWNGDEYRWVRNCHKTGQYDKVSICKACCAWPNHPNLFLPWQYKKNLRKVFRNIL